LIGHLPDRLSDRRRARRANNALVDPGDSPAPAPAQGSAGGVKGRARGAAGRVARPITFRFAQLQERADHTESLTTTAVQRIEELQSGLWGLATRVDEIGGRLEMVFDQLDADMQVMGEFARITERLTRRLGAHADDLAAAATRVERRAGSGATGEHAFLLPFVFASLSQLEPGSRVLVYDEVATPVALGLAGSGHRVSVVDARPYPYAHPGLEVVGDRDEPGAGPEPGETFAAVVCIRTAGSGSAGPDVSAVLGRFAPHVAPGGRLVASVAGPDADALAATLSGWTVLERRGYRRDESGNWSPADGSDAAEVTVVSASPA
jgi:hypothetical protein